VNAPLHHHIQDVPRADKPSLAEESERMHLHRAHTVAKAAKFCEKCGVKQT